MASRDRGQGFGFVYVDIAKLLKEKNKLFENPSSGPVHTDSTAKTINFNRDELIQRKAAAAPVAAAPAPTDSVRERAQAIQQIRDNLDRLQSLHHKLHAMLNELNQAADKKRKN